ncbi:MAG: methyltransferase [Alphaproteobacteria bacterium]
MNKPTTKPALAKLAPATRPREKPDMPAADLAPGQTGQTGESGDESAFGESLSTDALMGGKLLLRQPLDGYRAAIDPVLLAAAVPAKSDDRVLDAGTGAGAALLCLAARVPGCRITGIEKDSNLVQLARSNVAENGFAARAEIVTGDIGNPPLAFERGAFDCVMMNPPFLEPARARAPTNESRAAKSRAAAMVEDDAGLTQWIGFARAMLRDRGWLTLIHRADRIDDLMAALNDGFGAIAVFPLWPAADRAAKRVIIRARKNAASPAALSPGLVLHGKDGKFTAEAQTILRDARALEF